MSEIKVVDKPIDSQDKDYIKAGKEVLQSFLKILAEHPFTKDDINKELSVAADVILNILVSNEQLAEAITNALKAVKKHQSKDLKVVQ